MVAIFFSIAPQVIPVQTKLLALEDTGGTFVNIVALSIKLSNMASVFTRNSTFLSILMRLKLHQRSIHRLFVPKCENTDEETAAVVRKLDDFIAQSRNLFVLTGAGISTESGIRDYRSEDVGLYAVSDSRPMQYSDFLKSAANRRRYWARNYVGWEEFSSRQPNEGHFALATLEKLGKVHWLVTQNVDALHSRAGSQRVSELHGSAHRYILNVLLETELRNQ